MTSGGIGSWAAGRRVEALMKPGDRLVNLFADVKGSSTDPDVGEDQDTYRFLADAAARSSGEFIRVADGRTIWEVFTDNRFLGNSRLANCSKFLKQIPCHQWLAANAPRPADTVVYIGIDWSEQHRIPAVRAAYSPYRVEFPLTEPPWLDKADMLAWARSEGLEPPRAYALGYAHNNCGGGCVRSGQGQFLKLLTENPVRFARWERGEVELRAHLGKDVAICNDRRGGGPRRPLPLTLLRQRAQAGEETDPDDIGGCGCFVE